MSLKRFWIWYVDNAKTIFLGGFSCIDVGRTIGAMDLIYMGVFGLLSPVIVPIAAFFKTCFDWFTRRSQIDLSSKRNQISHQTALQFDALVDEIIAQDYYSSASQWLKIRLQNLPRENDAKLKESLKQDKIELANEQLSLQIGANAAYVQVVDLDAFKLEEKIEQEFLQTTAVKTAFYKEQTRKSQTEYIRAYMTEENNGKKGMQVIFGIYAKKTKQSSAYDEGTLIVRI